MLNGLPVHFRIIVVSTEPLFFSTAPLVEAVDVVMVKFFKTVFRAGITGRYCGIGHSGRF